MEQAINEFALTVAKESGVSTSEIIYIINGYKNLGFSLEYCKKIYESYGSGTLIVLHKWISLDNTIQEKIDNEEELIKAYNKEFEAEKQSNKKSKTWNKKRHFD